MPDPITRQRLIAKDISYQAISNLASLGLAWIMFGNIGGCIVFGLICFVAKTCIFYVNERIWDK
jgi:uncharacterized membrane protein